jgi:hypothetical protein
LSGRIDVTDTDRSGGSFGRGRREESCSTFAVSDGDGERRADHLAKEDGRLGGRGIDDLDLGNSSFESAREVLLEERPVFRSGDEVAKLREELTSVADGEGEGVLSVVEELGELLASAVVKEDRFRPSVSGSENVSV